MKKNQIVYVPVDSYRNATGSILFNMTNDYMFRTVNQKNSNVPKGIICAILHLKPENVQAVEITNPIELGDDMDDKTFVLDINILLNNSAMINLEMQVINEHNWQERSLSYLCRSFDQLYQGEKYTDVKPVIHAGFLNFQPFPDFPEFHAVYKLKNVKNGMVYSDKFLLNVIDLTHIELSTDADKKFHLDAWAKFFTATTWEEIIMLAENNPYIKDAAQTLYEANADEITKMKCRARRDYYKQKNTTERIMKELSTENVRLTTELARQNTLFTKTLAEKDSALAEKDALIAQLMAQLEEHKN